MTSAKINNDKVKLQLSKAEAVVFFEWLSRNWKKFSDDDADIFADPAEKQIYIWLENDLQKILSEPFDSEYKSILKKFYKQIVPNPQDW